MTDEDKRSGTDRGRAVLLIAVTAVVLLAMWKLGLGHYLWGSEPVEDADSKAEVDVDEQSVAHEDNGASTRPGVTAQARQLPTAELAGSAPSVGGSGRPCESDRLRTASTNWEAPAPDGNKLKLDNDTGRPLFVRMSDWASGRLLHTQLVLPSESTTTLVHPQAMRLDLATGSRWCNLFDGWLDPVIQVLKTQDLDGPGMLTMVLTPGDPPNLVKVLAWKTRESAPQTQFQATVASKTRSAPGGTGAAPEYIPQQPRTLPGQGPAEQRTSKKAQSLSFTPPAGVLKER